MIICPGLYDWTADETKLAEAVMEKYANCTRAKQPVPQKVFEAHARGVKTINSDIAVIDDNNGRVYLARRTDSELWSGMLHLPGTTHRYEWLKEATDRLLATELESFNLRFEDLVRAEVLELQDEPRAMCQSNLFIAKLPRVLDEFESHFYYFNEIPMNEVVFSHRTVTLPWLHSHDYIE